MTDYFNTEAAKGYDEKNAKLAPIAQCMHFLIQLLAQDLPSRSHALCVGVGTGAEILSLCRTFPDWTFVGVDPSEAMLKVCKERLQREGVLNRCELIHGYVQNLPAGKNFDVALSVLVAHFVKRADRVDFFQGMTSRLKPNAYLVNTEISFDLNSNDFSSMLKQWEKIQSLMGATPESLASLGQQLRDVLSVISPSESEEFLRKSGIQNPIRFFQAFLISGWYGRV